MSSNSRCFMPFPAPASAQEFVSSKPRRMATRALSRSYHWHLATPDTSGTRPGSSAGKPALNGVNLEARPESFPRRAQVMDGSTGRLMHISIAQHDTVLPLTSCTSRCMTLLPAHLGWRNRKIKAGHGFPLPGAVYTLAWALIGLKSSGSIGISRRRTRYLGSIIELVIELHQWQLSCKLAVMPRGSSYDAASNGSHRHGSLKVHRRRRKLLRGTRFRPPRQSCSVSLAVYVSMATRRSGWGVDCWRRSRIRSPRFVSRAGRRAQVSQTSRGGSAERCRFAVIFDTSIFVDRAYRIRFEFEPLHVDPSCFDPEAPRISYAYFLYEKTYE